MPIVVALRRRMPCPAGALACSLLLALAGSAAHAQGHVPFTVGTVTAEPGSRVTGWLTVPAAGDPGAAIPITVVHGARPGPVLALVAGVHGSEYTPIIALQRVAPRLDARAIAGTVLLVHVANVPAFLGRTIYTGPVDGKNLNRSFPGRADGTLTERIAHVLTRDVIRRADYVVDLHCGDANEALRPWTGYYARHGTPEVIARSRDMAVSFGLEHVVRFPMEQLPLERALYTGSAAVALGKPSFDVEVGGLGRVDPSELALIERGTVSLLRHLGMLDGAPAPAARPRFIERRANLRSEADGIFHPVARLDARVAEGELLGFTTDFFGTRVQEFRAPHAGIVLMIFGTPPVRRGETAIVIADVDDATPR